MNKNHTSFTRERRLCGIVTCSLKRAFGLNSYHLFQTSQPIPTHVLGSKDCLQTNKDVAGFAFRACSPTTHRTDLTMPGGMHPSLRGTTCFRPYKQSEVIPRLCFQVVQAKMMNCYAGRDSSVSSTGLLLEVVFGYKKWYSH